MEPLTIAWYVLTITIVAIFVAVIIFTKSRCTRAPTPGSSADPTGIATKPHIARQQAPPTPAPAYSEFAPPSYDDAVRRYMNQCDASSAVVTTIRAPAIFVITINETETPRTPHQLAAAHLSLTSSSSLSSLSLIPPTSSPAAEKSTSVSSTTDSPA